MTIIAIDGASRRNGKPDCVSAGAAVVFLDNNDLVLKVKPEYASTSQRGEINGLILALEYAVSILPDGEDIIVVTDSEYLHNTIMKEWLQKWYKNDWVGSTGPVKNRDLWEHVYKLLQEIHNHEGEVYLNWTKGHLLAYSPSNIKNAMEEDVTGYVLYDRISTMAKRDSEFHRLVTEFNKQRREHDYMELPAVAACDWVIYNTVADCIASYTVGIVDCIGTPTENEQTIKAKAKEAELISKLYNK